MSDGSAIVTFWTSVPLAVGLAMDAAVVSASISASLPTVTRRHAFRLAWHFGLFQFFMPILGWLLGTQVIQYIDGWDHWVAALLLAAVGGHMLYEAVRTETAASAEGVRHRAGQDTPGQRAGTGAGQEEGEPYSTGTPDRTGMAAPGSKRRGDPTRGWSLVMLSIGTSIDALAVGLAIPMLHMNVWEVVPVIGVVTAGLVLAGIAAGRAAGRVIGRAAEVAGGVILVAMGLKILLQGLGICG